MAPRSSTLAWKIPWMEEPGRLQSNRVTEGRTRLSDFTFTFHFHVLEKEMATHSSVFAWRIHGQRSLVGYSPWGCKELDMSEQLIFSLGIMVPHATGLTEKKKEEDNQVAIPDLWLGLLWSPGSSFYILPSECMSSRVTVPSWKREKDHKGTLCERFGGWLGNGPHHSNVQGGWEI